MSSTNRLASYKRKGALENKREQRAQNAQVQRRTNRREGFEQNRDLAGVSAELSENTNEEQSTGQESEANAGLSRREQLLRWKKEKEEKKKLETQKKKQLFKVTHAAPLDVSKNIFQKDESLRVKPNDTPASSIKLNPSNRTNVKQSKTTVPPARPTTNRSQTAPSKPAVNRAASASATRHHVAPSTAAAASTRASRSATRAASEKPQPAANKTQPGVNKTQPGVAKTQSGVAKSQAGLPKTQPGVTKTQAAANKTQAAVKKPAPPVTKVQPATSRAGQRVQPAINKVQLAATTKGAKTVSQHRNTTGQRNTRAKREVKDEKQATPKPAEKKAVTPKTADKPMTPTSVGKAITPNSTERPKVGRAHTPGVSLAPPRYVSPIPEEDNPEEESCATPSGEDLLGIWATKVTLRGDSFAAENFEFQPPENVKSFTFNPLSPNSVQRVFQADKTSSGSSSTSAANSPSVNSRRTRRSKALDSPATQDGDKSKIEGGSVNAAAAIASPSVSNRRMRRSKDCDSPATRNGDKSKTEGAAAAAETRKKVPEAVADDYPKQAVETDSPADQSEHFTPKKRYSSTPKPQLSLASKMQWTITESSIAADHSHVYHLPGQDQPTLGNISDLPMDITVEDKADSPAARVDRASSRSDSQNITPKAVAVIAPTPKSVTPKIKTIPEQLETPAARIEVGMAKAAELMEVDENTPSEAQPMSQHRSHRRSNSLPSQLGTPKWSRQVKQGEQKTGADAAFKTPIGCPVQTPQIASTRGKRFRVPKNNRSSLILADRSPEEVMMVLENSPMVEINRRRSKLPIPSVPKLDPPFFDDDLPKYNTEQNSGENTPVTGWSSTEDQTQTADDEMDTTQKQTVPASTQPEHDVAPAGGPKHDVEYFKGLAKTTRDRIMSMINTWTEVKETAEENNVPESAMLEIHAVVGSAQLLMSKKGRYSQFEGLVDECEHKTGEKEVTTDDLRGFWDLISVQVDKVMSGFDQLSKLRTNNWVQEEPEEPAAEARQPEKKKAAPKKKVNKGTKKPVVSKFAEFRKKMQAEKQKSAEAKDHPEAAVMNMNKPEPIVFNSPGFFQVSSPARSKDGLRLEMALLAGETPRSKPNTPRSSGLLKGVVLRETKSRARVSSEGCPGWRKSEEEKNAGTPTGPAVPLLAWSTKKDDLLKSGQKTGSRKRSFSRLSRLSTIQSKSDEAEPDVSVPTALAKLLVPTASESPQTPEPIVARKRLSKQFSIEDQPENLMLSPTEGSSPKLKRGRKSGLAEEMFTTPVKRPRLSEAADTSQVFSPPRSAVRARRDDNSPSVKLDKLRAATPGQTKAKGGRRLSALTPVPQSRRRSTRLAQLKEDELLQHKPAETTVMEEQPIECDPPIISPTDAPAPVRGDESPATQLSRMTVSTPSKTPKSKGRRVSGFTPEMKTPRKSTRLSTVREDLIVFSPVRSTSETANTDTPAKDKSKRRSVRLNFLIN